MSAATVAAAAPPTLAMTGGGIWDAGEWTDDTALTLAAAKAYQNGQFLPDLAAQDMVRWLEKDPKDVGNLTRAALLLIRSGQVRSAMAGITALQKAPGSAGNGSLMRALPPALAHTTVNNKLIEESIVLSLITHAEPRCGRAKKSPK